MRPRPERAALAAALAALALAGAACSGGDEAASGPGPAPAPAPAPERPGPLVRVVDGDTGGPVAGARVRAGAETTRTDDSGSAALPAGTRRLVASAVGRDPVAARVRRRGPTEVELYQRRLQSPQYGGGTERTRYVPAVTVPPPDGSPEWTFDGRTLIEFPPAVADGLAVFGTNAGRVFALDSDTGDVRWARRQKGYIAATPAIDDDRVLVSSMDGMLSAYTTSDGEPLWQRPTAGSPVESSPLVVGDTAYVGDWNGELIAVDTATGAVRWTFSAGVDIKGSAALAGDLVVVGDYGGRVHALDRETGAERWTYSGGQRFYGGPGVSGDTIVIGDVGGAVIAVDARTGAERWRHSTGGYVYSSPAIADGRVFIGSYDGQFQALDLDSGAVVWTHDAGGRISGSATVVGDVVYTAVLAAPGEARVTFGLDVRTGAVRYRGDDGRYSPAVAAGRTLFLVGTRRVYAHRAPTP